MYDKKNNSRFPISLLHIVELIKSKCMHAFDELINCLDLYIYQMDLKHLRIEKSVGNISALIGFDPVAEGLSPRDFAQKYYHPDDKEIMSRRLNDFRAGNLCSWHGVYRIKHKLGHWVWVYSKLSLMEKKGESEKKLAGIMAGFSSALQTQSQLAVLNRQLNQLKYQNLTGALSNRETQVLKLISLGKSYTEIAAQLNIHPETVNSHRKNIMKKLKINSIAQLICFAKETGLI